MPVLLAELLSFLDCPGPLSPAPLVEITGISDHSARVRPNNIFVAVKGMEHDGHDYIGQAVAQGASAVIAEKAVTAEVPVFIVPDTRIALAQLSKAWYRSPAQGMKMIGVTASNGKTTTAFMIDSILSRHYQFTGLVGTVVVKDGVSTKGADLTTPNSLELYEILARMRDNHCSHVTMEVSSAAQELRRVHGISYDIVTFNNVTREHIDYHGSFERYWEQKTKLVRDLSPAATAVLNGDEPTILALGEKTAADSLSYSLKSNPAPIQITDIDLSAGTGNFRYRVSAPVVSRNFTLAPCDHQFSLKVLGLHNIYNAAVAITVGKLCQVPDDQIQAALASFGGVERRFQLIYDREFKVIDDHFANVGNIDITLATLGLMKYNLLHLLIAIRGSRGSVVNRENTETLIKWLPLLPLGELVLTDSVEFAGVHDVVSPEERTAVLGLLAKAGVRYRHFPRLTEAVLAILTAAGPGDVVLMGGCQGLDHGAHIAVPYLAQRFSPQEKDSILEILKDRVAGSS
jgi:UDP-N-acetylmuramoyl-L-alanyl-D-glutamate--2,6-diaminopimelate ligase